jgi:hypothetical protein
MNATNKALPGFKWVLAGQAPSDSPRLNLITPSGNEAATVFLTRDAFGHNWFVWDENGTGGENSTGEMLDSMREAEAATVRWGRHQIKSRFDDNLSEHPISMEKVNSLADLIGSSLLPKI